jgi:hypothetical protein
VEILILALLGGLAYFWYTTRPVTRAPSARTREAGGRPSSVRPPDDDDDFLGEVDDQLRRRNTDGE